MSSASLVITPTPLIRSNHFRDFLGLVVASRYSKAPNLGFSLLVGLSGLEPPTSRLSGVRSNRLSYKPIFPAFDSSLSSLFLYLFGTWWR